jgi:hypothetical protein
VSALIDTMNSPSAKNETKIMPMIASSRSRVRERMASMAAAASPPARKAPAANGRPSM